MGVLKFMDVLNIIGRAMKGFFWKLPIHQNNLNDVAFCTRPYLAFELVHSNYFL